jgi:(S)-2-hydroxy-acid oxidase
MNKATDDVVASSREQALKSNAPTLDDPITVSEVEELARRRLPKNVYDYYACGADDQYALTRNIDAFCQ